MTNYAPLSIIAVAFLALVASGCSGGRATEPLEVTPMATETMAEPTKVALLLPLSGRDEKLGTAMQNAASLALTDLGDQSFEVVFADTASSPAGAVAAMNQIIPQGVKMVLGPIFAEEARAIRPSLGAIPMIAFSTDSSVAAPGAFLMGVMPQDQAQHVASFAHTRGVRNTLIIAANDAYGQLMVHTYALAARQLGQNIMGPIWLDAQDANLPGALATIRAQAQGQSIDAIFLPLPAERSARIMTTVRGFLGATQPLILGTGLWDEMDVAALPTLDGAYYAGPASSSRTRFEQAYIKQFGARPPRLASLAYDSVALAITIARQQRGNPMPYTIATLTNPSGFSGINGLFRFRSDGTAERSLAVIQASRGGRTVMVPAALSFAGNAEQ
jgi:ABC-type branched-subunit amino acid transport system substrate-binding protein